MQEKIKNKIINMGLRPHMYASNKESFVFQIHTMLYLIDKTNQDIGADFFKKAGILYGCAFVNCNDDFDDSWAKMVVDYALSLI